MERGIIPNCPVTKRDILRAKDIFGPNLRSLKGKTNRKRPSKLIINALYDLPEGILEEHGDVTMGTDIMYIDKNPFIVTTSRSIYFGTVEMMQEERKATIIKSLQQVINTYHGRCFKVHHILVYRQFECITKYMELAGITVNTRACDKQIPEVERDIRTIKERFRDTANTLSFEQLSH